MVRTCTKVISIIILLRRMNYKQCPYWCDTLLHDDEKRVDDAQVQVKLHMKQKPPLLCLEP